MWIVTMYFSQLFDTATNDGYTTNRNYVVHLPCIQFSSYQLPSATIFWMVSTNGATVSVTIYHGAGINQFVFSSQFYRKNKGLDT